MKTLTVFALLCAMMALTTAAGEHHVIERSASCPGGWNLINGRCFLFVPRAMTWARAELNCQSMGANLASVHLAEEYHGIKKMIEDKTHGHPQTWLGGFDAEELCHVSFHSLLTLNVRSLNRDPITTKRRALIAWVVLPHIISHRPKAKVQTDYL
uniref:type-2 ice-structuring protein-like n=1 Tax=Epinephelus lanceolatus TaxID=310571 RepID=UPI001445D22F|nr:type-2 ice-structuring protein-like [Epinephelus lanceolatus]